MMASRVNAGAGGVPGVLRQRGLLLLSAVAAVAATLLLVLVPLRHPVELWRLWRSPVPGSLPVPVEGVRARQIADTWGGMRSGGRRHRGVDIFARRGTPVRSAARGLVARVGRVQLGGNAVTVVGPGLYLHYYAHLDSFGVFRPGDTVREGDVLGYVGDTGNAKGTPCHLHYGLYRLTGRAVNPWPLFKDRQGG